MFNRKTVAAFVASVTFSAVGVLAGPAVSADAATWQARQQFCNFPALRQDNRGKCLDSKQRRIRLRRGIYSSGTFFVRLSQRFDTNRAGNGWHEWGGRLALVKPLPPLGTTEPAGAAAA
jgi:hypothetical protein